MFGSFYASQFCLPGYKIAHGGTRARSVVITETEIRRRRLSGGGLAAKRRDKRPLFLSRVGARIKRGDSDDEWKCDVPTSHGIFHGVVSFHLRVGGL